MKLKSAKRIIQLAIAVGLALIAVAAVVLYPLVWRYSAYFSVRHAIESGDEEEVLQVLGQYTGHPRFDVDWTLPGALADWPMLARLYHRQPGCTTCKGDWRTLLNHAALLGQTQVMERLLELGGSVSLDGDEGFAALQSAVSSRNVEAVALLIENGADINASSPPFDAVAMHQAAGFCDSEVLGFLIDTGAELNAVDNRGRTPLDWASIWNTNAIPFLLSRGAVYGDGGR